MICSICPRKCNVDRAEKTGICRMPQKPVVSKYMIHHWEEPPISGTNGSGAIFFAGCNLQCVFCQNHEISHGSAGNELSVSELAEIFLELESKGVHNINLVTPSHFIIEITKAIELAKSKNISIPFVYNTSAYESEDSLKLLDGLIDIYLPDLKYFSPEISLKYSSCEDYFIMASSAISEMKKQVGINVFSDDGILKKGMIIRHLILPGQRKDSMKIIDWIARNMPDAYVSLLSQYIPSYKAKYYKEINRKITSFEYDSVVDYFFDKFLTNGYIQERKSADECFVPDFLSDKNS